MTSALLTYEDEARSMSDSALAEAVQWADKMESPEYLVTRQALHVLGAAPGEELHGHDPRRVAAIRAESLRRENGGAQDLVAVAKFKRVLDQF